MIFRDLKNLDTVMKLYMIGQLPTTQRLNGL